MLMVQTFCALSFSVSIKKCTFAPDFGKPVLRHWLESMEDWQSDRMRWTRNPVYPFRVSGV